jgi:hypothetical protein
VFIAAAPKTFESHRSTVKRDILFIGAPPGAEQSQLCLANASWSLEPRSASVCSTLAQSSVRCDLVHSTFVRARDTSSHPPAPPPSHANANANAQHNPTNVARPTRSAVAALPIEQQRGKGRSESVDFYRELFELFSAGHRLARLSYFVFRFALTRPSFLP